jgi:hypothetical protein
MLKNRAIALLAAALARFFILVRFGRDAMM